jgi:glycosyltransferase involved in cell wall biosynthesis
MFGGNGPILDELILKSQTLGIADSIIFVGNISWDKVPEFLASSNLFILPSVRDQSGNIDGLPTVLLEAMACGTPVVASRLGGIPLVIKDGHNGILVPPGDVQALTKAILELIKNDDVRNNLRQQARMDIINQFELIWLVRYLLILEN